VPDASVPRLVTVAVNVTLAPNAVVAGWLSVRLVVVAALLTVCVRLFDVLAEKLPSPEYAALIVCGLPVTDNASVNVAWLVVVHRASVNSVPLSLNVTVPVAGVPKVDTVAVNVVATPNDVVALALAVRLVVVVARVTVCARLFDVLAEKLPSPL